MSHRVPLPPSLRGHAIRTADAPLHEVGRGRLRGSDVAHPFHGVSSIDVDDSTMVGRCRSYEPLLREAQWFSHLTALALFGAPLARAVRDGPLDLIVLAPRTPPRSRGVRGHVAVAGSLEVGARTGFPVVSAADAWVQSAPLLTREDLVAAGDFLVTGRRTGPDREPPHATLDQLSAAVARSRRKRGAVAMSWALPRIRIGADSRPETLLRLLITSAGLPEPELRHPIAVESGRVLHPDLVFAPVKVALEYEGDVHRVDRATWLNDIERREALELAGWRVVRVTSRDVFEFPELFIARLRRILGDRSL